MTAASARTGAERAENVVQVLILLAIGGMAGAASFTHMHDWTMDNSPAGTGEWFGWANAVISELTPLAAGLEARRRRRNGVPAGYPVAVLVVFAALSLAAQFSQATPSPSGWLLAGLPAIGFLALVKLVLATPAAPVAPAPATEPQPVTKPVGTAPADPIEPKPEPVPVPAEAMPVTARPSVLPVPVGAMPVTARPSVLPVPVGAFTRVNGTAVGR